VVGSAPPNLLPALHPQQLLLSRKKKTAENTRWEKKRGKKRDYG